MDKNLTKNTTLLLLCCLLVNFSFAQDNGVIHGVTLTGVKPITKNVSDVMAYERAHPTPADFRPVLRPELEGPDPKGQNPLARAVRKEGSLVTGAAVTSASVSTGASLPAFSNFLTIWGSYAAVTGKESPYTPPDNCGDVGFTQVIATANCKLKVFAKPSVTGPASITPTTSSTTTLGSVLTIDLNGFFSNSALGISGISDPHVRFDRLSGRWFVVAIDINNKTNNYCCVAVSDGPTVTATTNFKIYYFNVSTTGGSSRDFYDYPTLGVDKNYLYVGGNMFASGRTFSGSNMWVINKANLIAGSLTVTGFAHGTTKTDMYTPQGVHNDDDAATQGYFIGASQTAYSKLVMRKVNYGTTPTLSADIALTTVATYTPKTVPTLGGTAIDGGDRRLYAAMVKKNKITGNSSLWIAQGTLLNTSGIGGSGGDRDGAYWAEIGNLTGTPSILQSAMLYDGTNATSSAVYYTYPTIALSGQGHNLVGFTSAGPAKYCQAAAATRFRTDAVATLNAPTDFTNATSSYNPGANRWGDYTQTVVDPEDDMTMWTFSEYAPTTNAWGVRAAQFVAPPPAAPALAAPPVCGTSTVTINGVSTNHSEFFEPGSTYAKHLAVSVSGPSAVPVSNVIFVSPTQLTATFNTSGAASGTYTVTVTNPDGQSASTTFTYSSNCATAPIVNAAPNSVEINKVNTEVQNDIVAKAYPNPTTSIVNFQLQSPAQQKIALEVYDLSGKKMISERLSLNAGYNQKQLSLAGLPAGSYIIVIKDTKNNILQKGEVIKN